MSKLVYAVNLVVHVDHIDIGRVGNIIVMLFGPEGFPKDHSQAISLNVLPAVKPKMTVRLSSVPIQFAIKIHHDEDKTGKVSKNWTGFLPAEGLGFSNGASLHFGPPSFSKAKVKRLEDMEPITINMIYP